MYTKKDASNQGLRNFIMGPLEVINFEVYFEKRQFYKQIKGFLKNSVALYLGIYLI